MRPLRVQWSEADDATLLEFRAAGRDNAEVALALGRTADAVRMRYRALRAAGEVAPAAVTQPEEKQAMADSSAQARIAELERKLVCLTTGLNPQRLPVETAAEPPTDPAELWRHCEEDSARRIKYFQERTRFSINFNETDPGLPVAVATMSDQHISPGNIIDFARMRRDAELVAETPGLYALLGGDGVDNHIVIRPAALAARSQPAEQWQLYEWWLGIFAPKIVAMISGNHDNWTDQVAGVDMVADIARRNRLCYAPHEARVKMTVGSVEYKWALRHRYRFGSSISACHAVKQWWRMGPGPFDVGGICHQHEPACEEFEAHGQKCWAYRPGAYQVGSSFTKDFGFNDARATCPTVVLYPDRRELAGFSDVRAAARFLKSERGGK